MMKTLSRLLIVASVFLAACAHQPFSDRYWLRSGVWPSGDAASLLHYAAYARALTPTERQKEVERQKQAYAKDKSDFRRLQYAMVLNVPTASVSERSLALQTISPLLREPKAHDADLCALAELLAANVQNQRRGDDLEKKLNAVKDIERNLMQRERGQ